MKVDLHVHTTASDGLLSPKDIIVKAKENGINTLAIADHDTIDGISEGMKAANEKGIKLIPALEISAKHEKQIHMLGYFIDYTDLKFQSFVNKLKNSREDRNQKMLKKLGKFGFEITMEELKANAEGNIGRPHIADIMVKKGYVSTFPEAFEKYIGNDKPCYVPKERPDIRKAIEIIRKYKGVPVLAHPKYTFLEGEELENFIAYLSDIGLGGLEVYYSKHNKEEEACYLKLAKKYSLIPTAGSDYHREGDAFGMELKKEYLDKLLSLKDI
ncbi:MAG: DNA polymerase III PolC [Candidatus Methanofastidiosum methylothiophilum]|uniref:DNA polymerase III PolC n=1 Tax=Candidatus Methanofastidiosum methylothiophilum TaxID=1705564 RepID=A0A150J060_9EURY|nr:MAG: DNA polymerase III PolC [Candidatus Methanofastidiosum methylthiophilus]KYC47982.1 MAG: DNA polymerase III PolC [Candidatus Methanofastidiosum methylthiophilus]KYC50600.1 MAG: DNA polymerase III PolC [Candidatus Methanofastidiosum methylthiophilus]